jgi:hypothetical protein
LSLHPFGFREAVSTCSGSSWNGCKNGRKTFDNKFVDAKPSPRLTEIEWLIDRIEKIRSRWQRSMLK